MDTAQIASSVIVAIISITALIVARRAGRTVPTPNVAAIRSIAVMEGAQQYHGLVALGYTPTQARSTLRATIKQRYGFNAEDARIVLHASIQTAADMIEYIEAAPAIGEVA